MKDLEERIKSFGKLKDGWDSYGARATTKEAIKTALGLVEGFRVVPTGEGGIQFEGYVGKEYLELEISAEGVIDSFALFDDCKLVGQWRRDGQTE